MESLEVRRFLAADFAHVSATGTLLIAGTSGDDSLSFALVGSQIQVALNQSVLTFARAAVKRISLDAAGGNDFVIGDNNLKLRTTILGSNGDDSLTGNGGDNSLAGGAGDDRLQGLGGNDTLDGGAGADFMFGATGHNWVDYSSRTVPVFITLGLTTAIQGESGEGDTIVQIDGVVGGSGSDVIHATDPNANATLFGGAESDTLTSSGGRDSLVGGVGADVLDGGDNSDTLLGEGGNDQLAGNLGADWLDGGAGNDRLFGNGGIDTLTTGSGDDQAFGAGGDDFLYGNAGNDSLDGGSGNDRMLGSGGSNTLLGQSGNDTLISSPSAADILSGGSGTDRGTFDSSDNASSMEQFV